MIRCHRQSKYVILTSITCKWMCFRRQSWARCSSCFMLWQSYLAPCSADSYSVQTWACYQSSRHKFNVSGLVNVTLCLGNWLAFYRITKIKSEKPWERSERIKGHVNTEWWFQCGTTDDANRNTSGKCLMVSWLDFLHTLPFDLLYICELSNLSVFDHHALGGAGSNLLTSALKNTSSGGKMCSSLHL